MSRIRGRDTRPEMIVRRIAHGPGFRFRLHCGDRPGTPSSYSRSTGPRGASAM